MNSIVFTSAAQGGKASGSGADALTAVGSNNNDEWKLTIKDESHNDFGITTCEGSFNDSNGVLTFLYEGARVEDNSYISAIIVGSDDSIKYYGRVAEVYENSGQVTVNTAGKLQSGDRLYVYNEQYNGDKTTDYASNLVEVSRPTSGAHDWAEADCTTPPTCKICGSTNGEALGHDYQIVDGTAKDVTCTEAGRKADQKCSRCQDMIYGADIPAPGHDWSVDESTNQDGWRMSTTGSKIIEERTCSVCEYTEKMEYTTDHVHFTDPPSYSEEIPASCTENGVRAHYVCSCGYWFEVGSDGPVVEDATGAGKTSDDFVIESLGGHEWKDATCETPKTCVQCGATKGSPLAHNRVFDGWVWTGNEANGYTGAVANYKCIRENCGDVRTAVTDLQITAEIPPTCTAGGKTVYKAVVTQLDALDSTYRSEKKEGKFTDPLGHDYQAVEDSAVTPTCTEAGKEADQKCSRCGTVIEGSEIPAAGHKWDKGTITKKATTTETGIKTFTCTVCGETRTETIAKLVKKANPLAIKAKTATVKYKKLKKKTQTLAVTKVVTFTQKGQGAMTYTKASGNKKIMINKTTGKVTIKKKLKKGKYKVKVQVKAAGNANYAPSAVKTVTFTVKVK